MELWIYDGNTRSSVNSPTFALKRTMHQYIQYVLCMYVCVFVCMYVRVYVANFTEQSDISEMLLVCTSSPGRFSTVKIICVFPPIIQQHYS
jgi:hypothetical protein